MKSSIQPTGTVTSAQLAELTEYLIQQIKQHRSVDWDALSREFPQHVPQLRELLPALQLLEQCGPAPDPSRMRSGAGETLYDPREVLPTLGDFQLIREVGRGGMGVVYESQQLSLNRRVALKILPLPAILDERQLTRFKNESRAAALLHHTNIAPVYSVGCERGIHYYAMQYIDGHTLAELLVHLKRACRNSQSHAQPADLDDVTHTAIPSTDRAEFPTNGEHPENLDCRIPAQTLHAAAQAIVNERSRNAAEYYRAIARLGIQAAEALEHAHQHGVLHRDIKPANLMLDRSGTLWVTDFGLARYETDSGVTRTGDLVGTLRYMSPEQATGKPDQLDHRADIYSLGISLYELLALQSAVDVDSKRSVLQQITEDEPHRLRKLDKRVPVDLDTIVLKAISKNPEDRYGTAQQLADDLRRFLDHQPIAARRATLPQKLNKWIKRHRPLVAVATASLVFSLAVLLVNLWWAAARERVRLRAVATQERLESLENARRFHKLSYCLDLGKFDETRLGHDMDGIRGTLDTYIPRPGEVDARGFEWHYFSQLLETTRGVQRRTINAHTHQIYCLAFSSDGRLLVSASEDRLAKIWEYPSMTVRHALSGHANDVNWAAFSPDDKELATCSDDGTVRVWSVERGSLRLEFAAHPTWEEGGRSRIATRIAYSPDGRMLATMSLAETRLWDAATGQQIGALPGNGIGFFRDAHTFATAVPTANIKFWDTDSQAEVATIQFGENGPAVVKASCIRAAGAQTVLAGGDGYIYLLSLKWDNSNLVRSRCQSLWTGSKSLEGVFLSPDGTCVATAGSDGTIGVWDIAKQPYQRIGGRYVHGERAWTAIFSPDQTSLLTTGYDGRIVEWNVRNLQLAQPVAQFPAYAALVSSYVPDGAMFVCLDSRVAWTNEGDRLHVFDTSSWTKVAEHSARSTPETQHDSASQRFVDAMAISPSGQSIVLSGHGGVFLWNRETPDAPPRCILAGDASGPPGISLPDIRGSTTFLDEKTVAVIHDGLTEVVPLDSSAQAKPLAPPGIVERHRSLAVSPDRRWLAIGGDEGSFWLFDLREAKWQLGGRVAARAIGVMRFLPSGNLLALGSDDATIAIWDLSAHKLLHQMAGHRGPVVALDWHPVGPRLVSAGVNDAGKVRFWDVDIGRQASWIETEPRAAVYDIDFAPDGQSLIASLIVDETVGKIVRWHVTNPSH